MMVSKEWVIHKRLNDASPMPRLTVCRGDIKSTAALIAYWQALAAYAKRPICIENPPIKIRKELNYEW